MVVNFLDISFFFLFASWSSVHVAPKLARKNLVPQRHMKPKEGAQRLDNELVRVVKVAAMSRLVVWLLSIFAANFIEAYDTSTPLALKTKAQLRAWDNWVRF